MAKKKSDEQLQLERAMELLNRQRPRWTWTMGRRHIDGSSDHSNTKVVFTLADWPKLMRNEYPSTQCHAISPPKRRPWAERSPMMNGKNNT